MLAALARALRLADAERDYLFLLAGGVPPQPGQISDTVRPSVLRLTDRFTDLPAMLLNARWSRTPTSANVSTARTWLT